MMSRALETCSPVSLPAISTAEPASMLLLPEWLASQLGAVSDRGADRTVVDRVTREVIARVPTIPRSKMPTGPQRAAIQRRITELHAASQPGPTEDTLLVLADLIQEHAPSRLDERTVSIKAEAYLDALEDLPAWTIREAVRRWRRGDVAADAQTLDFAPKPPRLRKIAEGIALVAKGQALRLQRILDAEPEEELSEAEREANQRRLAALIPDMRANVEPERPSDSPISSERLAVAEQLRALEEKRKAETEGAGA